MVTAGGDALQVWKVEIEYISCVWGKKFPLNKKSFGGMLVHLLVLKGYFVPWRHIEFTTNDYYKGLMYYSTL